MGGLSLSVHPLFFAFGFYYALTGKIFLFVICTATALAHELGHSIVASSMGYKLNKITLMPFGAVVKGDIEGLNFSDQIKIALAGPMVNLLIALFFIAAWWIVPEIYAYTDVVASVNLSMAIINLLPVYPLDGGRVLEASLKLKLNGKQADLICSATGCIFSLLLIAGFVFTLFNQVNLSLLFFASFVMVGTFGKARKNKYVRFFHSSFDRRLENGIEVKRIAVDKKIKLKKVMGLLDYNKLNELEIFDNGERAVVLSHEKLVKIMETGDIYAPISKFLG